MSYFQKKTRNEISEADNTFLTIKLPITEPIVTYLTGTINFSCGWSNVLRRRSNVY